MFTFLARQAFPEVRVQESIGLDGRVGQKFATNLAYKTMEIDPNTSQGTGADPPPACRPAGRYCYVGGRVAECSSGKSCGATQTLAAPTTDRYHRSVSHTSCFAPAEPTAPPLPQNMADPVTGARGEDSSQVRQSPPAWTPRRHLGASPPCS